MNWNLKIKVLKCSIECFIRQTIPCLSCLVMTKKLTKLKKQFAFFLHLHHDLKMNCTTYILFLLCMQKQLYCLYWQTPLYAIWIKILTDYGIAILSLFESLILNGIPSSINTYLMMHLYIMLTPILDVWKKQ